MKDPVFIASSTVFSSGDLVAERYRISRFIAEGAAGQVYEAEDLELDTRVALKVLRPGSSASSDRAQRFVREVQLARRVSHPNVCRIYDFGRHTLGTGDEILFLSMELVDGETLTEHLARRGALDRSAALVLVEQIAAALDTAHRAGVIHRDLKPGNVLLTGSAGEPRAVVTDFGLSRHLDAEGDEATGASSVDRLLGTPAYVAPELLEGEPATRASDIYSLGAVVYELVTGVPPFTGDSPAAVALKRLRESPPAPSAHRADLDSRWERAILRCLERLPGQRFASAGEFASALARRRVTDWRRNLSIGLAAAAALTLVFLGTRALRESPPETLGLTAALAVAPRTSIAVLPFKGGGGGSDDAWLGTTLTELLRLQLAAGSSFLTIPGETVERVRIELQLPPVERLEAPVLRQLQRMVHSELVVLGSYAVDESASDPAIELTARVQEVATGVVLFEATERTSRNDPVALAAAVAAELRQSLGSRALTSQESRELAASLPSDPRAAELYSLGLERLRRFDAEAAASYLERALEIEPGLALAQTARAQALLELGYEAEGRVAAERAFALSSGLSREHKTLVEAQYRMARGEYEAAIDLYEHLWHFFPDDLEYGLRLAETRISLGLGKKALEVIRELRLLPSSSAHDPRIDLAEAGAQIARSDFHAAIAAARAAVDKGLAAGATLIVARGYYLLGSAELALGEVDAAGADFTRSRNRANRAGDTRGAARARMGEASVLAARGQYEPARARLEELLTVYGSIGDQRSIAKVTREMAENALWQQDFSQSHRLLDDALEVAEAVDNHAEVLLARSTRGKLYLYETRFAEAEGIFRELVDAHKLSGDRSSLASSLNNLGIAVAERGALDEGLGYYREALEIHRETGFLRGEADALNNLALAHWQRGNLAATEDHLRAASEIYERLQHEQGRALAANNLGELYLDRGETESAARYLREALRIRNRLGVPEASLVTRTSLAHATMAAGRLRDATEELERILEEAVGDAATARPWALALMALALADGGDLAGAAEWVRQLEAVDPASLNRETALSIAVVVERLRSRLGEAPEQSLRDLVDRSDKLGLRRQEYQARLGLGEVELLAGNANEGQRVLSELIVDAERDGFGLIVGEARTLLDGSRRGISG